MSTHHEELNGQKSPSSLVAANFCGPDRNHTINSANSYAGNDTSKAHPGDIVSRSLENCAQKSPQRTKNNGFDSSAPISK